MLDLDNLDNPPLNGAQLITQERHRQIIDLGYRESDADYTDDQLPAAAASYIFLGSIDGDGDYTHRAWAITNWPWDRATFKTDTPRIRALVKAGALLAAEIDRLLKLEADEQPARLDD